MIYVNRMIITVVLNLITLTFHFGRYASYDVLSVIYCVTQTAIHLQTPVSMFVQANSQASACSQWLISRVTLISPSNCRQVVHAMTQIVFGVYGVAQAV